MTTNLFFLLALMSFILNSCGSTNGKQEEIKNIEKQKDNPKLQLFGNRFFTFSTVVRVNQIETSRDETHGEDESSIHSPAEARVFREAVEKGWPWTHVHQISTVQRL